MSEKIVNKKRKDLLIKGSCNFIINCNWGIYFSK